jgi:hypothetical protein
VSALCLLSQFCFFVFLILCLFLSKKFTLSEMSIVSEMECFFFFVFVRFL